MKTRQWKYKNEANDVVTSLIFLSVSGWTVLLFRWGCLVANIKKRGKINSNIKTRQNWPIDLINFSFHSRMDSIIGSVGRVANVKVRNDDDIVDRLNHFYTTGLLIIFTVVVSARQYVGDPIRCWCPAEFPGTHVDYTNNICWISNTYYIPMDEVISIMFENLWIGPRTI